MNPYESRLDDKRENQTKFDLGIIFILIINDLYHLVIKPHIYAICAICPLSPMWKEVQGPN
jgi:hypothetical protein